MASKKTSGNDLVLSGGSAAAPARSVSSRRGKRTVSTSVTGPASSGSVTPQSVTTYAPTHTQIAQLAYTFWEARGYVSGSPEEDWTRAEQQLLTRPSAE